MCLPTYGLAQPAEAFHNEKRLTSESEPKRMKSKIYGSSKCVGILDLLEWIHKLYGIVVVCLCQTTMFLFRRWAVVIDVAVFHSLPCLCVCKHGVSVCIENIRKLHFDLGSCSYNHSRVWLSIIRICIDWIWFTIDRNSQNFLRSCWFNIHQIRDSHTSSAASDPTPSHDVWHPKNPRDICPKPSASWLPRLNQLLNSNGKNDV